VKATTELPDDPALPGLRAIRAIGVAGALPALELDAGMFLATIWRYGFDHEPLAGEVDRRRRCSWPARLT